MNAEIDYLEEQESAARKSGQIELADNIRERRYMTIRLNYEMSVK